MDDKEREERLAAYLQTISGDGVGGVQLKAQTPKHAKHLSSPFGTSSILERETIICLRDRPAVCVRGDTYDPLPEVWASLNTQKHHDRIGPLLRSIGRVERMWKGSPDRATPEVFGTAFVVGEGLVMTNRHVAEAFTTEANGKVVLRLPGVGVDWRAEAPSEGGSTPPSECMAISGVRMVHPYWDMALLEVADLGTRPVLKLAGSPIASTDRRVVVVVGYPTLERDPTISPELVANVFGEERGVKRLAPGRIKGMLDVTSDAEVVRALAHDGSTLGGTSGSPVVDLETGVVLGLHFGGRFLVANHAVPTWELARDPRVVAEKLTFDSKPVQGGQAPEWLNRWQPMSPTSNAEQPSAPNLLGDYLGIKPKIPPVRPESATLDVPECATEARSDGDTQEIL